MEVKLGHVAPNGVSASMYALVERGVAKRPRVARSMWGKVEIRFAEDFAPVRLAFQKESVLVEDWDGGRGGRRPDLLIQGSLPDIVQLAAAPLWSALARVARRSVRIEGSPLLARRLLKLLEL
jgi:hypothetical protein